MNISCAFVLISTDDKSEINSVISALKSLDLVTEIHATNGMYDIVVKGRVR